MSSPTEVNTQQIVFEKILVYRSQNVKIGQDLSQINITSHIHCRHFFYLKLHRVRKTDGIIVSITTFTLTP